MLTSKDSNTLEPRYNTIRYNTNSDITRMRFGPQFFPNLPFFRRVNTVIKTVNYFTLTFELIIQTVTSLFIHSVFCDR